MKILNRKKLIKEFNKINCTSGSSRYERVLVDGNTLVFIHNNGVGVKRIWNNPDDERVIDYTSLFSFTC